VANKKAQENHRVDGKCKSPESKNSREKRERERVVRKRDDGGGLNQEKENGRMKSVGRRQQKLESWGAVWLLEVL
jgi:hypothetical protein